MLFVWIGYRLDGHVVELVVLFWIFLVLLQCEYEVTGGMEKQDPVCTADGIIYQREAILENLVKQKKAIARQMTAWEAQQSKIASQVRVVGS